MVSSRAFASTKLATRALTAATAVFFSIGSAFAAQIVVVSPTAVSNSSTTVVGTSSNTTLISQQGSGNKSTNSTSTSVTNVSGTSRSRARNTINIFQSCIGFFC